MSRPKHTPPIMAGAFFSVFPKTCSEDQTDSLLEGAMPNSGTYHAIVENVAPPGSGADLEIRLQVDPLQ